MTGFLPPSLPSSFSPSFILGFEFRVSHLLGKHSITWTTKSAPTWLSS
jgi:hypothetical protein